MIRSLLALLLLFAPLASAGGGGWTMMTDDPGWDRRSGHTSAVFNAGNGNRLWVLGGLSAADQPHNEVLHGDVWYTLNGLDWILATDSPGWSSRHNHATVVFDNKLWVLGGNDPFVRNDVWYSENGADWTQVATSTPMWTGRAGHAAAAFNGKMWVMGGVAGGVRRNDVWCSDDGENWVEVTDDAPWERRVRHKVLVFGGKLWLMGGAAQSELKSDVWYTENGTDWVEVTDEAPWSGRHSHAVAAFGGRLWVLGGYRINDAGEMYKNDVWSAPVGNPAEWTQYVQAGDIWSGRRRHTAMTFNPGGGERLWVIGGDRVDEDTDQLHSLDDVWTFAEAPTFTSTPTLTATADQPYSYVVTVEGAPPPALSAGPLPGWLTFNPFNGQLFGTPAEGDIGLSDPIEIAAANVAGSVVQNFQIEVLGVPPQVVNVPAAVATAGTPYVYVVDARGTPAPTLSAGPLPDWLTFDETSGELSGTPPNSAIGSLIPVEITASNGWGADVVVSYDIQVRASVGGGGSSDSGCAAGSPGAPMALVWLAALALFVLTATRTLRQQLRTGA